MILASLPAGSTVFVDANTLVYHASLHPTLGPPCTHLLDRIALQDVTGYTSTHILSEATHRLMTLEACATFGWPYAGIAARMQSHPAQVQTLTGFRQAIEGFLQSNLRMIVIDSSLIRAALAITRQTGLLTNDALVVAAMKGSSLSNLASGDADFDRAPGIVRYSPL